jgi:Domain of unknown function (DUF4386)
LIAATSAFATVFLLFPILRRHAEGLAAGYMGLRAFENVFYVASVVGILAMLRVSQSDTAGSADTSQLALLGAAMMALRDWSTMIGTLIFAGLGAVTLNYVLYRSRLAADITKPQQFRGPFSGRSHPSTSFLPGCTRIRPGTFDPSAVQRLPADGSFGPMGRER